MATPCTAPDCVHLTVAVLTQCGGGVVVVVLLLLPQPAMLTANARLSSETNKRNGRFISLRKTAVGYSEGPEKLAASALDARTGPSYLADLTNSCP